MFVVDYPCIFCLMMMFEFDESLLVDLLFVPALLIFILKSNGNFTVKSFEIKRFCLAC